MFSIFKTIIIELNIYKMKSIFTIFLIFISLQLLAQDEWESWDKNYKEVNFSRICNLEKAYADSIEKNKDIPQYYSRLDKYKIKATYLGKFQVIDSNIFRSMKNVFKQYIGNPEKLEGMIEHECLFQIDGYLVWLPIQEVLRKALINEVIPTKEMELYCLFMNEHSSKGQLNNIFLVSEFRIGK